MEKKLLSKIYLFKLIERMINFDPHTKTTIKEVCNHPVFREPNQIVPFLKECVTEDPQLMDEYRPVTIDGDFLMTSHRFGVVKIERKVKQIKLDQVAIETIMSTLSLLQSRKTRN